MPLSPVSVDVLVLRRAGLITLIVGVLATAIGWAVKGSQGAIAGAFATIIVLAFFSIGQFILGAVLRSNPAMALNVALLTYLVKVGVLFLLIIVFQDTTLFDRRVFGATIVACTIAWTAAEMWVFATTKVLYVEPGSGPGQGSGT